MLFSVPGQDSVAFGGHLGPVAAALGHWVGELV